MIAMISSNAPRTVSNRRSRGAGIAGGTGAAAADIVVDELYADTVGVLSTEAMAAGCAVVGSRAPGVAELIEDGRTGWLATTGDPVSFADAIAEALGAEGPVRASAGAAFARAGFGLGRMATEYEQLFEQLYAAKRQPSE